MLDPPLPIFFFVVVFFSFLSVSFAQVQSPALIQAWCCRSGGIPFWKMGLESVCGAERPE